MSNDLISREALKEAIRKRLCISSLKYLTEQEKVIVEEIDNALTVETSKIEHKAYNEGFKDGVEQGIKLSETPGEWVAAKNRFPDTEGEYLVSLDNGRIVVADDRSIIENHDFEPKMLAWQPLPEPYCGAQMEKEGEE